MVALAIFFGLICWNILNTADRTWLDKVIRKTSSVLGYQVKVVGDGRTLVVITAPLVIVSPNIKAAAEVENSFSHRLLPPKRTKEHYNRSFLSVAVDCITIIAPTKL